MLLSISLYLMLINVACSYMHFDSNIALNIMAHAVLTNNTVHYREHIELYFNNSPVHKYTHKYLSARFESAL